jgi:hypothetical protein
VVPTGRVALAAIGILVLVPLAGVGQTLAPQVQQPQHPQQPQRPQTPVPPQPEVTPPSEQTPQPASTLPPLPQVSPSPEATSTTLSLSTGAFRDDRRVDASARNA